MAHNRNDRGLERWWVERVQVHFAELCEDLTVLCRGVEGLHGINRVELEPSWEGVEDKVMHFGPAEGFQVRLDFGNAPTGEVRGRVILPGSEWRAI